jgi:signal peptidase II
LDKVGASGARMRGRLVIGAWAWLRTWSRRRVLFVAVVSAVVVLDQVTKFWAVGALTHAFDAYGGELGWGDKLERFLWLKHPGATGAIAVSDAFWHFRYAENPGAVFSFLRNTAPSFHTPFLLGVALVAMVFIVVYYRRTTPQQTLQRVALALVFGGALGNFLDRVRLGYVIDFIDWHWYEKATWPTFNVADAAITCGVALLVLEALLAPRQRSEAARNTAKAKSG